RRYEEVSRLSTRFGSGSLGRQQRTPDRADHLGEEFLGELGACLPREAILHQRLEVALVPFHPRGHTQAFVLAAQADGSPGLRRACEREQIVDDLLAQCRPGAAEATLPPSDHALEAQAGPPARSAA